MSVNLDWIGVQGGDRTSILNRLGFEPIGEASSEMNPGYACVELPGDWLILVAQRRSFPFDKALGGLATEAMVLSCEVYEVSMGSSVRALQNGKSIWSVSHDPDKGGAGLEIDGEPPLSFNAIRSALEAEQNKDDEDDVDYMFDAPVRLAHSVCGYNPGQTHLNWTVLDRKGAQKHVASSGKSLTTAMRSELLPFLQSQGWTFADLEPDLANPWTIVRHAGNREQTVYFDYVSGTGVNITVKFETRYSGPSGVERAMGIIQTPEAPFWKRLLRLDKTAGEEPLDAAIRTAKSDILTAEDFLKTGERKPNIHLYKGVSVDEDD
jgi:hypothetical protein